MALTFHVDASLSASIGGLSWVTLFAGTFPDRRYHQLDASMSGEDMVSIVQSCSPALEEVFRWKSLRHKSPGLCRKLKETMPLLLDLYVEDEDQEEEDEDEEDEDDDEEEEEDEDEEEEDEDDGWQVATKEDGIFAEDVITVLDMLLEFSSQAPGTPVGTGTLEGIVDEVKALRALCVIAHESLYDMRWVLS